MKGEIPVCKRCCCCLPLRYGLLTWGYIKIIAEGLFIPFMVSYLLNTLVMYAFYDDTRPILNQMLLYLTISFLTLTSLITDSVATIVFIIGGHKKNVKLLRGFYFYSIAMLIVTTVLITSAVCISISWFSSSLRQRSLQIYMIIYSALFIILALQSYFLLLLRSEVIKLRIIGEFRFVNNAANAECTMTCEEQVVGQINETESEDV